jgi:hypothetical protein
MERERDGRSSPDLFSINTGRNDPSSPPAKPSHPHKATEPAPRRYVLPNNLHEAVKYLNDDELDSLRAATLEEMKRRGRVPPSVGDSSAQSSRHELGSQTTRLAPKASQPRRMKDATLTKGQVNAVRAAFMAGITPARIARRFGISQSNVRKALASDDAKR